MQNGAASCEGVSPEGANGHFASLGLGSADASPKTSDDAEKQSWQDLLLCTPGVGPQPLRYFFVTFVRTLNPATGRAEALPYYRFVQDYLDAFESGEDMIVLKSRQMFCSWLAAACFLHSLLFRDGWGGLMSSADPELLDDGGSASTTDSLLGRVRYLYEQLPAWMRELLPVTFAKNRISCETRRSYIVGDCRPGNVGRGGSYNDALVDEAAFIQRAASSHRSLRPAAKRIIYPSTPNGPKGPFAAIWKNPKSKFRKLAFHWTQHPERRRGLYRGPDGKPRSPWYDAQTADMRPEDRAREHDLDLTTSQVGLVYKVFARSIHVPRFIGYDPRLPIAVGIDFGHARKTAAVIAQPAPAELLRVIGDFEGKHRSAPLNAKDLVKRIRDVGYQGPLSELELVPDPSAQVEETGSGQSILSYYRAAGFLNWRFPMITGPNSVQVGIQLVDTKLLRRQIAISNSCETLVEHFESYQYEIDRRTEEEKGGAKPLHDMASHMMDALRYLCAALYVLEDEHAAIPQPELETRDPHDVIRETDVTEIPPGLRTIAAPPWTRY